MISLNLNEYEEQGWFVLTILRFLDGTHLSLGFVFPLIVSFTFFDSLLSMRGGATTIFDIMFFK